MPAVRTLKRVKQLLESSCCFTGQTAEIEQRNTKRQNRKKHTLINKDENEHNRRTRLYTHHLTLKPDVHSIELKNNNKQFVNCLCVNQFHWSDLKRKREPGSLNEKVSLMDSQVSAPFG